MIMNYSSSKQSSYSDKQSYFYVNGEKVPLVAEPSIFALKYKAGRNKRDSEFSSRAKRFLQESENIGLIPQYELKIYRVNSANVGRTEDTNELKSELMKEVKHLHQEEPVEFSSVAFRLIPEIEPTSTDELMFVSQEFAVQFKEDITPDQVRKFNDRYSVRIIKELGYVSNGYLLEVPKDQPEGLTAVELANIYYESGMVVFANPNLIRPRHFKQPSKITPDPVSREYSRNASAEFINDQWHLDTAKVLDAWNVTTGNSSIKVAILDDGIDVQHPEFAGKVSAQYDFERDVAEGIPVGELDRHGTACAGVAVAKGVKAPGAAPGCSLIAVRTPRYLGIVEEAEMFQWVCDQGADIISCSWGPSDIPSNPTYYLADNVRAAISYCVRDGRNGKGIPIFWAAGNGNQLVTPDGYASNPDVMAIAASNDQERKASYSDFGPEIFICAPSNGGTQSIFTVDRRGNEGYNPNRAAVPSNNKDYTGIFGGTSSATPLVAGIAALILSQDPSLTRDQIKEILKNSADKIDRNGGNYDSQGHSTIYGYGRVNAARALSQINNNNNQLSINGPANTGRNAPPPTFQIQKGGRTYYAVELATDHNLFRLRDNRNENNFYASWSDALLSNTPFTPPSEAWDRLKHANRIYYRLHVGDDNSWSNHATTTSSTDTSSAPSIEITAADDQDNPNGPSVPTSFGIVGPSEIGQSDNAPEFQINTGGRRYYAVEVATEARLFDTNNHGEDRTDQNFYGSWTDGLSEQVPYTLPTHIWNTLKHASQLFYRMHVADDTQWSNYAVTTSDGQASNAPSISILGSSSPGPVDGGETNSMVRYPSGTTFNIETNPLDGKDYRAPAGHSDVPLIKIAGRGNEKLSTNFTVNEFEASDGADYARISPELIEKLQIARTSLGRSIIVEKGYVHPALNEKQGGNSESLFLAGKAVEIKTSSTSTQALQNLARRVIEAFNCQLGIGMKRRSLIVELRSSLNSWVESGAAMTEQAFDEFVRETCNNMRSNTGRIDSILPYIVGPEDYHAGNEPPTLKVHLGTQSFYGVEFASSPELFLKQNTDERSSSNYFNSWAMRGLIYVQKQSDIYQMPKEIWTNLQNSKRLFYRLVTFYKDTLNLEEANFSIPDDRIHDAPYFEIYGNNSRRSNLPPIAASNWKTTIARSEDLWIKKTS